MKHYMQRSYCRYSAFDTVHALSPLRINHCVLARETFKLGFSLTPVSSFGEEPYPPTEVSVSNYQTGRHNIPVREYRVNTLQRSDIHTTPLELDNILRSLDVGQPDGNTNSYCRRTRDAIRERETGSIF